MIGDAPLPDSRPLREKLAGASHTEFTSAALRRVEQERDRLAEIVENLASKLRAAEGERDTWMGQHTKTAQDLTRQRDGALDQWAKERERHDLTRAELASARTELDGVQPRRVGRPTPHLDAVKAELASARTELNAVRTARDRLERELAQLLVEYGQVRDALEREKARRPRTADPGEGLLP